MYPSCDSETVPAAMSCLTLVPSTAGTSLTSPSSTHTYLASSAPSTSACSASDDSRWISPSVASPAMAHASFCSSATSSSPLASHSRSGLGKRAHTASMRSACK